LANVEARYKGELKSVREEAEDRRIQQAREFAVLEAAVKRSNEKNQKKFGKMQQQVEKLEELRRENEGLRTQLIEVYQKYHQETPPLERERVMYMSVESYEMIESREQKVKATLREAADMWDACEKVVDSEREVKAEINEVKNRLLEAFDRFSHTVELYNTQVNQRLTSTLVEVLLGEEQRQSISPAQLDEVWEFLPVLIRFRLLEMSTCSELIFEDLGDLYYRLGGKANGRMASILLPLVYSMKGVIGERLNEDLHHASRRSEDWVDMSSLEEQHYVSCKIVDWIKDNLETILKSQVREEILRDTGVFTLPRILTFLHEGGMLFKGFRARGNLGREVSDEWMKFSGLQLAEFLPSVTFSIFYWMKKLPCVVAKLSGGFRRDRFPFPLEDLQPEKLQKSSWWDEDTPSLPVIHWLEMTAQRPPLEEYFGNQRGWPAMRSYHHKQLKSIMKGQDGSVKLRALTSGSRHHFMSQWTWTGLIKVSLEGFDNCEDLSDLDKLQIWVQSVGNSKEKMAELRSPFMFRFYCVARCLVNVQKVATEKVDFRFNEPMPCGGWKIYPLFAAYGPHMVRMYNWMVKSGFMYGEDPELRIVNKELSFSELKPVGAKFEEYLVKLHSGVYIECTEGNLLTDTQEKEEDESSAEEESNEKEEIRAEIEELTEEDWSRDVQRKKRTWEEGSAANPSNSPPRNRRRIE
jgi:hypothetical protein